VFERLDRVGGRSNHFNSSLDASRTLQFDEGPSWYAMPDLIDGIFARYHAGGRASLYNTTRLDPSYRIRLPGGRLIDVPGTLEGLLALAGPSREPALRRFFSEAQYKYEQGVKDWLWRPMVSFEELISPKSVFPFLVFL
jgi:phytoene desaturase